MAKVLEKRGYLSTLGQTSRTITVHDDKSVVSFSFLVIK